MTTETTQQETSQAEDIADNLVMADDAEDLESSKPEGDLDAPADIDKDMGEDVPEDIEAADDDEPYEPNEPALEAPPKWDKRFKDVFEELGKQPNGREWQEAMLDQYNEGQGYTTQVEQERADFRRGLEENQKYIQGWNEILSPHNDLFVQTGLGPDVFVRQGLGLIQSLKDNPGDTIRRLAQDANVDLNALAMDQQFEDPNSKRIRELEARLRRESEASRQRDLQRQAHEAESRRAGNEAQIEAFATEVDDKGVLTHPHLELVQNDMSEMFYGRRAQQAQNPSIPDLTLQEAYDRACKLHPDVTQAESKAQAAAALARKNAKAKKALNASRRVAGDTSGKPSSKLSLKDEIRKNIRAQA